LIRSFDPELAKNAAGDDPRNESIDWQEWLDDYKNVMVVDGDDVGLGTFEYPGVYNVHWFFVSRGKYAKKMALEMLDYFFTNHDVKALRGLTPTNLRGACWLARQLGFKSYGTFEFAYGPCELFCMTKDEFYNKENK
jgi:hypothetical protein